MESSLTIAEDDPCWGTMRICCGRVGKNPRNFWINADWKSLDRSEARSYQFTGHDLVPEMLHLSWMQKLSWILGFEFWTLIGRPGTVLLELGAL